MNYNVVPAPNYAAPLLNFSPLSGQQQSNQNQQNQQNQQQKPQNPYAQLGGAIRNWAGGLFNPQPPVGQPMNIGPGTTQGANAMLSGIY